MQAAANRQQESQLAPLKDAIGDLAGADVALKRMVGLENEIDWLTSKYEERITKLREDLEKEVTARREQIAIWHRALNGFARKHDDETFQIFEKGRRSVERTFGTFGYRWGKWTVRYTVKAETVVNKLEADGHADLVKVTKRPLKKKLVEFSNDVLEKWGARKTRSERFFVDLKREEVKS